MKVHLTKRYVILTKRHVILSEANPSRSEGGAESKDLHLFLRTNVNVPCPILSRTLRKGGKART